MSEDVKTWTANSLIPLIWEKETREHLYRKAQFAEQLAQSERLEKEQRQYNVEYDHWLDSARYVVMPKIGEIPHRQDNRVYFSNVMDENQWLGPGEVIGHTTSESWEDFQKRSALTFKDIRV